MQWTCFTPRSVEAYRAGAGNDYKGGLIECVLYLRLFLRRVNLQKQLQLKFVRGSDITESFLPPFLEVLLQQGSRRKIHKSPHPQRQSLPESYFVVEATRAAFQQLQLQVVSGCLGEKDPTLKALACETICISYFEETVPSLLFSFRHSLKTGVSALRTCCTLDGRKPLPMPPCQ